jgi:hypothetical protein
LNKRLAQVEQGANREGGQFGRGLAHHEFGPNLSIALPFVVIRSHDPSVDVLPRSSEKIRKQSLSLKRKARHELPWSGNEVAKDCKNLASEILNVPAIAIFRLNVRDPISAMVLITPAMDTEMSGAASLASQPSITI